MWKRNKAQPNKGLMTGFRKLAWTLPDRATGLHNMNLLQHPNDWSARLQSWGIMTGFRVQQFYQKKCYYTAHTLFFVSVRITWESCYSSDIGAPLVGSLCRSRLQEGKEPHWIALEKIYVTFPSGYRNKVMFLLWQKGMPTFQVAVISDFDCFLKASDFGHLPSNTMH